MQLTLDKLVELLHCVGILKLNELKHHIAKKKKKNENPK